MTAEEVEAAITAEKGDTKDDVYMKDSAPAAAPAADGAYPPTGIAPAIAKLPEWIQVGCGDAPYNCAEKNATFAIDGVTPADMPDLSKHSSFLSECLTKDIYDKLKDKKTAG